MIVMRRGGLNITSKKNEIINFYFLCKLPAPQSKVKMQYVHFRLHPNYFLLPWKIPKDISR